MCPLYIRPHDQLRKWIRATCTRIRTNLHTDKPLAPAFAICLLSFQFSQDIGDGFPCRWQQLQLQKPYCLILRIKPLGALRTARLHLQNFVRFQVFQWWCICYDGALKWSNPCCFSGFRAKGFKKNCEYSYGWWSGQDCKVFSVLMMHLNWASGAYRVVHVELSGLIHTFMFLTKWNLSLGFDSNSPFHRPIRKLQTNPTWSCCCLRACLFPLPKITNSVFYFWK